MIGFNQLALMVSEVSEDERMYTHSVASVRRRDTLNRSLAELAQCVNVEWRAVKRELVAGGFTWVVQVGLSGGWIGIERFDESEGFNYTDAYLFIQSITVPTLNLPAPARSLTVPT